ncbi:MAG TPA: SRPBCC family protein [Alphaproteobacteria bacterium]|jgi:phenylpropionate dioxygenase-like ring-hydroxylating dioxygenase large terminal subunit|nr:SRPBCC family protein [Alphaproteobacteria bacterium]
MSRQQQIDLLKRLLNYVESKTTSMAEAPWRNDAAVYTDPRHFAREREILFRRHPIVMGFASNWAAPGTYATDDFAGLPILIVRGRDGTLRALLNVCRHRGAKVAQGCGEARAFQCPYHGWSYDLAGRTAAIPDERSFPDVRAERPSLVALPLCEKYGLVWVMPMPAADGATEFDIEPWLGGLGPELASYGFGAWPRFDRRAIPEAMNWKLVVDTFHEGYHVGFLHRESLGTILHGNVTDFEPFGPNHRLTFPRKKLERLRSQPEAGWDLMWNTTIVYSLFPNTLLMLQGDHAELARVFPLDGRVDRAVMDLSLYVPQAPRTEAERVHWEKNMQLVLDVVTGEDFSAGRTIQLGLSAGAQTHTVFGRNEPAMIHYHRAIRAALGLDADGENDPPLALAG